MSVSEGDSRMSSVFGLNDSPQTATCAEANWPPSAADSFSNSRPFCRSFAPSTASSTVSGYSQGRAGWTSAFTSLGKQEPP